MNVESHPPPHWPQIFSDNPERLRWILLIIYVLFLNFWGLGRHGLFEPDENAVWFTPHGVFVLSPRNPVVAGRLQEQLSSDRPL